ncbi:MAG: hypothetical protein NT074_03665 [Methanomicrobiales archaeon]|nr:hypothetical protein [Methanomicrobiales archaeon]
MSILGEDLWTSMNDPQTWSDDELEERTRAIMARRGYPTASTCGRQELNDMVRDEIARGG